MGTTTASGSSGVMSSQRERTLSALLGTVWQMLANRVYRVDARIGHDAVYQDAASDLCSRTNLGLHRTHLDDAPRQGYGGNFTSSSLAAVQRSVYSATVCLLPAYHVTQVSARGLTSFTTCVK